MKYRIVKLDRVLRDPEFAIQKKVFKKWIFCETKHLRWTSDETMTMYTVYPTKEEAEEKLQKIKNKLR
jgi:hypothetical protein